MNYNNSIRDSRGNILGFKCLTCYEVFDSMWGTTCNKCREEKRKHKEIVEAIKSTNDKPVGFLQKLKYVLTK